MDIGVIYDYCLHKQGVTEDFPFDEEVLTFKVGGKIFLLLNLKKWEEGEHSLNLKCNPDRAEELRVEYTEITPGYHMSKKHWNTIAVRGSVNWGFLKELIDHSYDLVFQGLTKKLKEEILK
ncbi:MmcQ/YjbR family DNA-binding protein [Myroides phaeus]|uniref:Predicted DNA-binding protein, MmcQ/YjbR family n=1 Tax=Myroides phaeus TaxID=702745 RepID=A0A1G8H0H1_9FLAO|nr:MmcQ/YjbR family DNA-binding protein [Myroides phaeus]SDI00104.1 Predicted DNA-binding protein, MmcQ/YjbR family [Myroides phaeus]